MAVYRAMTIKSKEDAKKFLAQLSGTLYIMDVNGEDVQIHNQMVSTRPIWARGSVFNPYFVLEDPIAFLYQNRKYINPIIK